MSSTTVDFQLICDAQGAFYLSGPADYMDARGIDMMNAIAGGSDQPDALLDQLLLRHTDWQQAVLTRIRLDYANWKGVAQLIGPVQPQLFASQEGGE